MIIKTVKIEKFRAFENVEFSLGKRLTAIAGRNATQKTTLLGLIGQPFTISKEHPMYGCKTIDGYNFRSQFKEKFKVSVKHDIIGQHKWTLSFHNNACSQRYYTVESIARKQAGKSPTLRFWNAESRAKGAGYIQLPVYFLSLSRLFPIGESGKTKKFAIKLTDEEIDYCIRNYRTILSIQKTSGSYEVSIEQGTVSRTFAGVSDEIHDLVTNSAGEGDITRIILAVLSFKRLKEEYGNKYKGGILLIDELDATLHSFSQRMLVEYLWRAAKEYKIQIVFTTHSPIILKSINKYQLIENRDKGNDLPAYEYDSSIVYLEHKYDSNGKRTIIPKNISTNSELNRTLSDINLSITTTNNKVNVYCEDHRALSFVSYVLKSQLNTNLDIYMSFVDINLGWTNYIQLVEKSVPEFKNNIIILDGDVPKKREYRCKDKAVKDAGNILFLPLVIEKDLFILLKKHDSFVEFQKMCGVPELTYDICFNKWPLEENEYNTGNFKEWYNTLLNIVGDEDILFGFWCNEYNEEKKLFVDLFIETFNKIAEKNEFDYIPLKQNTP